MIVRQYDDRLDYTQHAVFDYPTEYKNTVIYKIAKVPGRIQVSWTANDYAITYAGKHQGLLRASHDTELINIVCMAATQMNGSIFVPCDENQDTLF